MSAANLELLLIIALTTATINIASTTLLSGTNDNKCRVIGNPCDPHDLYSCPTHCECVNLYQNYTCEQKYYPSRDNRQ
ncbi:hypothetical protein MTO96_033312 [Rhipicephalus appendiculatus]